MSDPSPRFEVKGGYMELSWLIASTRDALPHNSRLGLLALRAGDVSTAEHWFAQGMESADSEDVLGCVVGLAWVAWQRGDEREAQDLLERAHASGRSDAAFNLGILADAAGDTPLAQFWWNTASSSSIREIRAAAQRALADLMLFIGDYDLADDHAIQAALHGDCESIRKKVWEAVNCFDLSGLHYYLMLGKSYGDEYCEAMYEIAIVDLIREANTEWVNPLRLTQLAQHSDWRVRAAVRTNPTAPKDVRDSLLADTDARVRDSNLRDSHAYPPLSNAAANHRVFAMKDQLEMASMEVGIKTYPDNFILQAVWKEMRRQNRNMRK